MCGYRISRYLTHWVRQNVYSILLFFLAAYAHSTHAEITAGTVVALGHSANRAIMAADSRALIFAKDGQIKVDDACCKVAAAKDEFLIAVYGSDRDQGNSLTLQGKSIANRIIKSAAQMGDGTLDAILSEWQTVVSRWVTSIGISGIKRLKSKHNCSPDTAISDEIMDELEGFRETYAAQFDYDIERMSPMFESLRIGTA